MSATIKTLIFHHSYSDYGNAILIDRWHKSRQPPFKMIGYHWVICNGYPHRGMERPFTFLDGAIESGRPLNDDPLLQPGEIGAHAFGQNKDSLGCCLIGNGKFTPRQLLSFRSIYEGLHNLGIKVDVKGHSELMPEGYTECPKIDMNKVRIFVGLDIVNAYQFMFTELKKYLLHTDYFVSAIPKP